MSKCLYFFRSVVVLSVLALVSACTNYGSVEPDNSAPRVATHTIQELIQQYTTPEGALFPIRTNSGDANLFSLDTIPSQGDDIIIVGRIVSDDTDGNMYKYLVLQDLNDPKLGLKISVDASGISAFYPEGQVVSIRVNGMALGKYADMYQLGTIYFNDNSNAAKRGYEPGRMPLAMFQMNTQAHGMPNKKAIVIDTVTIQDLQDVGIDRTFHSRIVCIRNAYFNGKSQGSAISDGNIFAPSTNGIGYPQSRDIVDGTGGYVSIATSEYAKFAGVSLPSEEYKGDIIAIVNWYRDKAQYNGNVQLTIRSLDDIHLFSVDDGSAWIPVYPY